MNTPNRIWLLDNDAEISWCDDPDPAGLGDEAPDSAEYVKAEEIESLRKELSEEMEDHLDTGITLRKDRDEWKRLAEDRQATIDALMLEHCPDEMTPDQIAEYEENAVPIKR
ncbi:unnamed protein product [marine sediment metagenome]|uniref:Uncharacterized protein n=1 Tax=marine sediment metagenome TaxID=412755 RepID=X0TCW2_9ZZZZ